MNLIAIDPGRTTGWAVFKGDRLTAAGALSKSDMLAEKKKTLHETRVLIETPRWYPHDQVDTNDLLDLAVYAGELKHYFSDHGCIVELVWPRTWKGTVKKEIMTARILGRLTSGELALVPLRPRAKTVDHNVADAIGLGLWKLGRLR